MNYLDIIQDSIDYIEKNLKSELSASELAENAGFSLFHYYRLFQSVVGMPVMQYILRRKLYNAIYEISNGSKMIEVALSYGFDTHSGFFKAFKREFNCSPTQYLKKYKASKPYKINLSQEAYIMITDKKLRDILTNWELKEPIEINDLFYSYNGNKTENTWIVNKDFVLKTFTSLTQLKKHIDVSKALKKAGFEAAAPVQTKDQQDYLVENELYFCLTNRIKGESIRTPEVYEGNHKAFARYLGEVIGQLHLILKDQDKDLICNEPNLYETMKNWAIPKTKESMSLEDSFYEDYLTNFEKLYPFLPKHIIHRDPNPSNILMEDNRLTGFIDFEFSERNVRIFDPCYAATAILSESFKAEDEEKLNKWLDILKNIIAGYDSICNLSKEEKQAIPYVIYSIQMIFIAYLEGKDNLIDMLKVNKEMTKWLIQNKKALEV
jgi:Ser/Thr protein kinase RdoA (MazF antagonist)/AraC-like DNA-binding protein